QAVRNESSREFWQQYLADLPRLDLPVDLPAATRRSYRGGRIHFAISRETSESLVRLAREEGCTPVAALPAAYAGLRDRDTGQDDFAIGSVTANRRPEVGDVLGFFANTFVLRCNLTGGPDFHEVMRRIRRAAAETGRHAAFPFAEIAKAAAGTRKGWDNPLFQ